MYDHEVLTQELLKHTVSSGTGMCSCGTKIPAYYGISPTVVAGHVANELLKAGYFRYERPAAPVESESGVGRINATLRANLRRISRGKTL